MKLVLLQPPIQDFYETDIRLQPIGLCYLKAAIKKHLPEVKVLIKDFHRGWGRRTVPIPNELLYLKKFYPYPDQSPFSSFHPYYHFGADFETIAEFIAGESADLIGISSLFSPYYREVLQTAEAIKRRVNVPILCGGSHVSAVPELMLSSPWIDFVIRGEGERALVEFLKALQNDLPVDEVPNLGFKRNGKMIFNSMDENIPLEELPAPDLSDFSLKDYTFEKKPMCFVITSRSCPHRCTFCSVHQTFGLRFQRNPIQRVFEEIRTRFEEGYRVFDFEDDNLTYYKEDMKQLCRLLIDAFSPGEIQCVAMNGVSYLSLDEELLTLMKQAGFTHLNLALVSSDQTVRETTKRPHTIQKYIDVVDEAFRLGFKIVSYQILGLPNETLSSMIQTLVFNARLPVLLGASPFYLTPNSPIAKDFAPPSETDIFKSRLTAMAIETENFSRSDIYTLFVTTRILNFLKSTAADSDPGTYPEVVQNAKNIDGRFKIGGKILERLLNDGILYAQTSGSLKPLEIFDANLFFRIWNQLGTITTQTGQEILLPSINKSNGVQSSFDS